MTLELNSEGGGVILPLHQQIEHWILTKNDDDEKSLWLEIISPEGTFHFISMDRRLSAYD